MAPAAFSEAADLTELVGPACVLARRWITATRGEATRAERQSNARLAGLVRGPEGFDFSIRFSDRVVRPESVRVAARELARLRADGTAFLSRTDRALFGAGSAIVAAVPGIVVPLARRKMRRMIGHLVVELEGGELTRVLRESTAEGFELNLNVLGEPVLGEAEAHARFECTRELLARPDVSQVSLNVSHLVSHISAWDIEDTVRRARPRLAELLRAGGPGSSVNLDVSAYQDQDVTLLLFERILAEPEFRHSSLGLALQAYLPDSRAALERLIELAAQRHAQGGAPIKVRLVKGAHLSAERIDAQLRGWAQAPYQSKEEVDANYLALIDRAISADHGPGFRVGIATHNLYDVALGYLLARGRGVADRVDIEMLWGMASAKTRAVRDTVGSVIVYTPVVARADFDVAVAYHIRRLEEYSRPENFLHALFAGDMTDQEERFIRSVGQMRQVTTQRRRSATRPRAPAGFANTTDSDPALPEVRAWAVTRVSAPRMPASTPLLSGVAAIDEAVAVGRGAGAAWARRTPAERAAILRRAADEIETRRGQLVTALAHEAAKLIKEADAEVSRAVDLARWQAHCALELGNDPLRTDGLTFEPSALTLVAASWAEPVADAAGGLLAALAAGAAVLILPPAAAPRCAEIVAEAVVAAGVPPAGAQVVRLADNAAVRGLMAHDGVDQVVAHGSAEAAGRVIAWRSGRLTGHGVLGTAESKNAMVITPAADPDLAVMDLAASAFAHAGQHPRSASLAILVGEVGDAERFRRQLIDTVTSLRVGWPDYLGANMGPIIAPPEGDVARALTDLAPGESWLVTPKQLDSSGRLWSPGVRDGVRPGSWFHRTACRAPVLGIMRANDLDEAIRLQNEVSGLVGGLHSLDEAEINQWLGRVDVGMAMVNRPTTAAVVRRQLVGGWKASVVGPGAKLDGPDYVAQLGHWREAGLPVHGQEPDSGLDAALGDFESLLDHAGERAWLGAAIRSDARAWSVLREPVDPAGLTVEQNLVRRMPCPLTVRALAWSRAAEVVRVVLAALCVGAPVSVSLAPGAGAADDLLGNLWLPTVIVESDREFAERFTSGRVRIVGPRAHELANRLSLPGVTALADPVTANGRLELLSVLREQTISRTMHRYGHVAEPGWHPPTTHPPVGPRRNPL